MSEQIYGGKDACGVENGETDEPSGLVSARGVPHPEGFQDQIEEAKRDEDEKRDEPARGSNHDGKVLG